MEMNWAGSTVALAMMVAVSGAVGFAAEEAPKRAKPPVWTPDVLNAFFEDATNQLVGKRPTRIGETDRLAQADAAPKPDERPKEFSWSQLVSGDTLEAEVKRIVAGLREPLANPPKFMAGGHKQCQADFSVLAVLFAIIAEHDGDARWKTDAAALRDALARAGMNCKTATDQSYREAMQRKTELDDVIRGERLAGQQAKKLEKWSDLAERPLLMQRMEKLLQEELSPSLANAKEFSKQAPDVQQRTELLAVLANVMQRAEYEYWDDAGFQELSSDLRRATAELSRAAVEANYEAARAAAGRVGQACSACHEGYRG
jgi:cytochrome c556